MSTLLFLNKYSNDTTGMQNIAIIILYIIIVILLYILSIIKEGFENNTSDVQLVIANYEEDLDWVNNLPDTLYDKLTIYNKGTPKNYNNLLNKNKEIFQLPNVGREGHTYLHHIINNYDNLTDITIFLPGSTYTFYQKKDQLDIIISHLQNKKESIIIGFTDPTYITSELDTFMIDEYEITSEENKQRNPGVVLELASIRPFGKWIKANFPGETLNCIGYRGVVVVSKTDIHKRPREFYEKLITQLQTQNPEVGHYIERAWPLILSVDNCGGGNFSPHF